MCKGGSGVRTDAGERCRHHEVEPRYTRHILRVSIDILNRRNALGVIYHSCISRTEYVVGGATFM